MSTGAPGPAEGDAPTGTGRRDTVWRTAAHGPLHGIFLALTFVVGVVDAVSILRLGRVFVANMTGNVVFAGFAVVGVPGFSLGSSLVALAGFLIGAAFGGWLNGRIRSDRAILLLAACVVELALIVVALAIAASVTSLTAPAGRYSLSLLLALAMGVQNAVVRRMAVPDLTTTVLTMTLTGIAADVREAGWRHPQLRRRFLAVAAMMGGAVAGAELILHPGATAALALVTIIMAVVTLVVAATAARDRSEWRRFPAPH
jgi:uncharacterized membrane protein YoaK (UPF0700 family)